MAVLSLNEFAITETELKLIANAPIIGDNNNPKKGNKTPAAIGTPRVLYIADADEKEKQRGKS